MHATDTTERKQSNAIISKVVQGGPLTEWATLHTLVKITFWGYLECSLAWHDIFYGLLWASTMDCWALSPCFILKLVVHCLLDSSLPHDSECHVVQ